MLPSTNNSCVFNQESLTVSVRDPIGIIVCRPYFSKSDLSLIYYPLNCITMSNLGRAWT